MCQRRISVAARETFREDVFEEEHAGFADDELPEEDPSEEEVEELEESPGEETTGNDDQIDDPIRIYLMQMGEIPMLSRAGGDRLPPGRSSAAAGGFATTMLATDYMLQAAIGHVGEHSRRPGRGWTARSRSR